MSWNRNECGRKCPFATRPKQGRMGWRYSGQCLYLYSQQRPCGSERRKRVGELAVGSQTAGISPTWLKLDLFHIESGGFLLVCSKRKISPTTCWCQAFARESTYIHAWAFAHPTGCQYMDAESRESSWSAIRHAFFCPMPPGMTSVRACSPDGSNVFQ